MQLGEPADRVICKLKHDMCNKLGVILGFCDLLTEEAEKGSECARRLDIIRKAAEEMTRELRQRACQPGEILQGYSSGRDNRR